MKQGNWANEVSSFGFGVSSWAQTPSATRIHARPFRHTIKNPERIPSFSPRLDRLTEGLPGVSVHSFHYPERVATTHHKTSTTPSGLERFCDLFPGVARASRLRCATARRAQPQAVRLNPVGIAKTSTPQRWSRTPHRPMALPAFGTLKLLNSLTLKLPASFQPIPALAPGYTRAGCCRRPRDVRSSFKRKLLNCRVGKARWSRIVDGGFALLRITFRDVDASHKLCGRQCQLRRSEVFVATIRNGSQAPSGAAYSALLPRRCRSSGACRIWNAKLHRCRTYGAWSLGGRLI